MKRRPETPAQALEWGVTQIRGTWITPKQVKRAAQRVLDKLAAAWKQLLFKGD